MSLSFIADGKLYVSLVTHTKNITRVLNTNPDIFVHEPFDGHIVAVFGDRYTHQWETMYQPSIFVIDADGNTWSKGDLKRKATLGWGPFSTMKDTWGQVTTEVKFKMIDCGEFFTVAIDNQGYLWLCGHVQYDEWVNKIETVSKNMAFERAPTETKFVDVSAGADFFVAIAEDGSIWAQGDNSSFALGVGDQKASLSNLTLVCQGNFSAVSCSRYHSICLTDDGDVWGAGSNEFSELGFPNIQRVPVFTQMLNGASVSDISANDYNTILLLSNGRFFGCGNNAEKQLGPNPNTSDLLQININNISVFKQIMSLQYKTFVKDTNDQLWISGLTSTDDFMKIVTNPPFVVENALRIDLPDRTIAQREKRFDFTKSARKQ